ncbi:MAG: UDP-N-acetylmuramate--L-alanine ligase, partial [Oscillospiraceae bacterium]|nr:UDP-N-acetylmuramate--L-alanine ligase [Oscillospiraceae bacterium]
VTVADDYAHHPTELTVTLKAAKEMDYKRVWAVFQPFTYSRTVQHLEEFRDALQIADIAVLTDIMGSREKNTYGIYTRNLAEIMNNAVYFPEDETAVYTDERKYQNFADVCDYVVKNVQEGDLVLTMGCGDINKVAGMILKRLEGETSK